MASEFENTVTDVATKIAKYVDDIATLTVETRYMIVGPDVVGDFAQAKPAAQTVIKIDSDSFTVVPMVKNDKGELEIDATLNDVHTQNVNAAIKYRHDMLNSLLTLLQSRLG